MRWLVPPMPAQVPPLGMAGKSPPRIGYRLFGKIRISARGSSR